MENVNGLPVQVSNGASGSFTLKAAEAVGSTAGYLRARSIEEMISDAGEAARRNPLPSLIGAATLGVLLGAFLRRS